ncbi:small ribosomal subunit biogenesis GTPase RsgA [Alkalimarinus coralli]|uniref:small ribosomal subunit biogenesis GTPase RsgA n=1 Tax=Alkalimarinus coralli TaxID=2935863 RepID=UPI00202B6E43|nr:small ribosomal subunit biogenesis GTPase RsgA [Alkalimarinus coralli]
MAKRKLNRRQQWRIEKVQEERTLRAKKRERDISRQMQAGDLSEEQEGIVIAHFGQLLDIEAIEGEDKGEIHRCHVRANIDSLVTGDRVIWRAGKDLTGVIEARLDRQTILKRPDNFGNLKPVAANIDYIVIVIAPEPEPFQGLVDRYIVAAETVGIPPVILLNKTDLLSEQNRKPIDDMMNLYESLGYHTIRASVKAPREGDGSEGMSELLSWLDQHTSVFVGQSGVGKSSLIQSLLPELDIRVGALSENTRKGTHTTTTAKLFHLPSGGNLVDSPGIREFGLWHIGEQELLEGFIEFRPHLGLCRFRDCRHENEPKCAINAAVKSGEITERRMVSYRRIKNAIEDQNARGLTLRD